jgi:hypothetical protein
MASTPLYKGLKEKGTTFYAFPGAAEDISAAYQNETYKMYFSKYVLLNFPKQNTNPGTQSKPIYFDFENAFSRSVNSTPTTTFKEGIVESLRNYVANQEVVIRESRLNSNSYYYNTNALETTSEKIFWKWCKKLRLIDFEPAIPQDEFFSNLNEFESRNVNNDEFFPEFLWKEREIVDWDIAQFEEVQPGVIDIEFLGTTNFRVGDLINIFDVSELGVTSQLVGSDTIDGINVTVAAITPASSTEGQKIRINYAGYNGTFTETTGQARIVYNRLVQYIGEVNGISNVQEANRSYTEVYAHIPDHTGMTPDVLFRTRVDVNYKPNLTFPIIPGQYQPEILGAEIFTSPIVSAPQNYPGSYYGQFDTADFTYTTANGDEIRRSGDFFGVKGDINNPIVNGSTIDGLTVDFNSSHYVKMNIPGRQVTNFDEFNALNVNSQPPLDFEFNAILWYYTVENDQGVSTTNLYGISFLDNPENSVKEEEIGLRFPTYKKLVANGQQDGTSYAFNLNLNFNIINDNPVDAYNPEAINSLFSMNLFNQAMVRLATVNDSFLNIVAEQSALREEISNLRNLLYTQTDISVINTRINNLELLLRLYSSLQLDTSESIKVNVLESTPPRVLLESIDPAYSTIDNYFTSQMYTSTGAIPASVPVPENKNFMINLKNNDEVDFDLPNNEKLSMTFIRDLYYKQSVEIIITPTEFCSQNKKLDLFMISDVNTSTVLLLGDIDLPVSYNSILQTPNSSSLWKDFNFDIDFEQPMYLLTGDRVQVPFQGNTSLINNSIKVGDVYNMNNFFVGTASVYDFSGQYTVSSLVGSTSSYVLFDISSNVDLVAYGASSSLPLTLHGTSSTLLSNRPYFSLNKGKKIKITRVSNSNTISERYMIDVSDII